MKFVLRVLLLLIIGSVAIGYYTENFTDTNGKLYIGIGVSLFAFVLMPLFVYHRYNNRIGEFIDRRMEKEEEE